jgi:hypothetical protein
VNNVPRVVDEKITIMPVFKLEDITCKRVADETLHEIILCGYILVCSRQAIRLKRKVKEG